nr:hypothetical protein [Caballeronia arationis]
MFGGTTALSGGVLWIPLSKFVLTISTLLIVMV